MTNTKIIHNSVNNTNINQNQIEVKRLKCVHLQASAIDKTQANPLKCNKIDLKKFQLEFR